MTTAWRQPGLFEVMYGGLPPHQTHSDTSTDAALSLSEQRRATLRAAVLRYLVATAGGATDEEMQLALHMEGNTQRPRRCELLEAGLIADSGTRRLTRNRRTATVWIARVS